MALEQSPYRRLCNEDDRVPAAAMATGSMAWARNGEGLPSEVDQVHLGRRRTWTAGSFASARLLAQRSGRLGQAAEVVGGVGKGEVSLPFPFPCPAVVSACHAAVAGGLHPDEECGLLELLLTRHRLADTSMSFPHGQVLPTQRAPLNPKANTY